MANFKYRKLEDWIKTEIANRHFSAGSRIPTETELMEQFDISRQTVRLAISHLEEEGLLRRVQGSGTYVADHADMITNQISAPQRQTDPDRNVTLVMADTSSYIFPEIMNGAADILAQNGYMMNVLFTDGNYDTERQILQNLLASPPAGLIIEPLNYGLLSVNEPLFREAAARIPMLMLHVNPNDYCPALSLHDREGARMMVDHMAELGHRNIGAILCVNEATGQIRTMGYLDALRSHGFTYTPSNLLLYSRSDADGLFQPTGSYKLDQMIGNVTAILCQDDRLAFHLINYLQGKGLRVPEDISVSGYDDSFFSTLNYQITTVEHPKYQYGHNAGLALLDLIRTGSVDMTMYEKRPQLILRETVAAPKS